MLRFLWFTVYIRSGQECMVSIGQRSFAFEVHTVWKSAICPVRQY